MRSAQRRIRLSSRHCVSEGGRLRPPPKYCSNSIFRVRMSRSICDNSSSTEAIARSEVVLGLAVICATSPEADSQPRAEAGRGQLDCAEGCRKANGRGRTRSFEISYENVN